MPFQLKTGHHGAMDGKPPPPTTTPAPSPAPPLPAAPPRVSRLRRLLVRVSASERVAAAGDAKEEKPAGAGDAEVGSVGLDRMVLSFMEESAAVAERPPRGRCNCFNGSNYEESDDEEDFFLPSGIPSKPAPAAAGETLDALKGLVQSASVAERNLLADASRIAERCGRTCKRKAECRRAVAEGLRALGYDAAVCKSRWEKTPSYPAGEHEYIDAVFADGARLILELDFRSEFDLARSTKAYRAALQALPPLFVGTADRLGQIVAVVAEAARQSLKKKGLHYPPWRKPEYMRAKWLSPHVRAGDGNDKAVAPLPTSAATAVSAASFSGEFELLFGMNQSGADSVMAPGGEKITVVVSPWRPTEEASRVPRAKVVTGLSAVL
ncbi:uncharacterized protein [Lolium perenne]|uniref:uncharacterized protein n=1 Tax=Lolium perenne TaxID=4522 RepID=UPI0021EB346A|nr:uncharacterized protein LOC127292400 [Lolium perenne]